MCPQLIGDDKPLYVIVRGGSKQRKVVVNLRLSELGYSLSTRSRRRLQSKFRPTVACPLHSCIMKWEPSQNSQSSPILAIITFMPLVGCVQYFACKVAPSFIRNIVHVFMRFTLIYRAVTFI